MQFVLIPSLQYRFNGQGYYTPFYKDKLCKNKMAEFGKRANYECLEGGKFKHKKLQ